MTWLILVLVIVLIVVVAGALAVPRLRTRALRERFGPEYERQVAEAGDRHAAEAALRERVSKREALEVHDLEPAAQQAYTDQWLVVQQHFIDDPAATVADADELVQAVMRERGFPVDDFDERVDMVSVDHPDLAENYRAAHEVQRRSGDGGATTDDLREAFQRYRALFAELLATGDAQPDSEDSPKREAR
jgi:hypothetical protein